MIDPSVQEYLLAHTSDEPDILRELVEASNQDLEHIDMLCGPQVGQLLALLVRFGKCRRVLEVGTFTGYSAIWMANALPDDGELITLEMNERYRRISDRFLERHPYSKKVRQIMGDAVKSIGELEGEFDLIFLDADKIRYPLYLKKLKPLLSKGGVLVADNVLWGGEVIEPQDEKSRAVDEMNMKLHLDPDFETVMLPVRDGLMIARKQK